MMDLISRGVRALNQCDLVNRHKTTLMSLFHNKCNFPVETK